MEFNSDSITPDFDADDIDIFQELSSSRIRSSGFIWGCEKELLEESSWKISMSSASKSGVIESELKSMLSFGIFAPSTYELLFELGYHERFKTRR